MTNLNALSHETKNSIILDFDHEVNELNGYIEYIAEEARKELKGMTCKRDYWRTKFNDLNALSAPVQPRRVITTNELIAESTGETVKVVKERRAKDDIQRQLKTWNKIKEEQLEEERKPLKVIKVVYTPKASSTQTVKSTSGNLKGTKHVNHKTHKDILVGIMPNGDIIEFDKVIEAKDYIRETYKEFKTSPLTNISRAAHKNGFYAANNGMAYNIQWSYKTKEDEIIND